MPRAALRIVLAAAAGTCLATGGPAALPDEPAADPYQEALDRALGIEKQLVDTLAKVRTASVSVQILQQVEPPAGSQAKPWMQVVGCGSGVIVTFNQRTWIITNDHVAGDADAIEIVAHDGKKYPAELVDRIKLDDIALLRFTGRTAGLRGVTISPKASRDLVEGQWVLATGNPFFLGTDGSSVSTLGVVSGLGRILGDPAEHLYADAIQHDAAVNPGNSGGPLWNLKGDLVGINGMIASRGGGGVGASNTGASFAIPIDHIQPYLAKLADKKSDAQAGYLGVSTETATDAKGSPAGARVTAFGTASPARGPEDSGLLKDDVIVSVAVGGQVVKIRTTSDLVNALSGRPAGTPVRIRYRRKDREASWSGKLGAQS